MRPILMAIAVSAAFMGAAHAGTMDNAFANTLISTDSTGAASRWHFNADGSYHMIAPDNAHVSGSWAIDGAQLCLTPAGADRFCVPFEADKNVGDTWTTETENGPVTISITAGR